MSINKRIKQLRENLNLSQSTFAKDISISSGYIASIELGNRKANERIVKLICSVYGVNKVWLETGEGDMFCHEPDEKFKQALCIFQKLNPEFQEYVLTQIDQLLDLQKKLADNESK
jgi:transcriptional regulator with XRE-family HTH domain